MADGHHMSVTKATVWSHEYRTDELWVKWFVKPHGDGDEEQEGWSFSPSNVNFEFSQNEKMTPSDENPNLQQIKWSCRDLKRAEGNNVTQRAPCSRPAVCHRLPEQRAQELPLVSSVPLWLSAGRLHLQPKWFNEKSKCVFGIWLVIAIIWHTSQAVWHHQWFMVWKGSF